MKQPQLREAEGSRAGPSRADPGRKASSQRRPALYSPRPCRERLRGLSESGSTPMSPFFKAGQIVTTSELQFPHSLSSQER